MNSGNSKEKFLVGLLSLIFLFGSFTLLYMSHNKDQEDKNLIESLQDSIQTYKNKEGKEVVKTSAISTSTNEFLSLKLKDEEIKKLQKLVKEYKSKLEDQGSVTNFNSRTKVNTITTTKIEYDTIIVNNIQEIYPKYKSDFNLKGWVIGDIIASKDSTNINLEVNNEYSVIIGEESQGWFKPKKTFVEVINHNPYSSTDKLKTYQVERPKNKLFSIGPYIGIGVNQEGKFIPNLGVGLQYNLIKL